MNVVVNGADVARVAPQHRLQEGDDLQGALRGLALRRPELPRAQVHARLGEQRRRVEIIGIALDELAHGVAVVESAPCRIGVGRGRMSPREGLDVEALVLRPLCRERAGLLHSLVGRLLSVRLGLEIDVGSERKGDAPVGHGHLWVELGRAPEGSHGLVVIEGVHVTEALIEELLCLGTGRGDRVPVRAQAAHERRGHLGARRLRRVGVGRLRVRGTAEHQPHHHGQTRAPHGLPSRIALRNVAGRSDGSPSRVRGDGETLWRGQLLVQALDPIDDLVPGELGCRPSIAGPAESRALRGILQQSHQGLADVPRILRIDEESIHATPARGRRVLLTVSVRRLARLPGGASSRASRARCARSRREQGLFHGVAPRKGLSGKTSPPSRPQPRVTKIRGEPRRIVGADFFRVSPPTRTCWRFRCARLVSYFLRERDLIGGSGT